MIVTFNTMINTSATADAAFMNFLRCVTAIATAPAGTTSLTVNPYVNNTGTTDATKNCIVSIDANSEAGGWTTSSAHNVPATSTFTAVASAAADTYKADFYTDSGKTGMPYLKMTFHATNQTTDCGSLWFPTNQTYNVLSNFATYVPFVFVTFGCSINSAWTAGDAYTPSVSNTPYNKATTTTKNNTTSPTSVTLNAHHNYYNTTSGSPWQYYHGWSSLYPKSTTVTFRMAVTKDYCIIWEVVSGNSYGTGWSTSTNTGVTYAQLPHYGSIFYMGLRETQSWENSQSNNPPWVAWSALHSGSSGTGSTSGVTGSIVPNLAAGYFYTYNSSGVISATPQRYMSYNTMTGDDYVTGTPSYTVNTNSTVGISSPIFITGQSGTTPSVNTGGAGANGSTSFSVFPYLPVTDPISGSLVPPAYPITIKIGGGGTTTLANIAHNQGGACRGIYKSLNMPWSIATTYWTGATQTFNIVNPVTGATDSYIPIMFNTCMYLVRNA